MIASVVGAGTGAIIALLALVFGPPEKRHKWVPRSSAVLASFVVIYALQALSMQSFYDGGQGDNRYQLAILARVQNGDFFGDYFYRNTRAHYPPLFYWIAGVTGRLLGQQAEAALRWAPALALVLAGAVLAWIARKIGVPPACTLIVCFALGSFAAYYLFSYPPDRGLWGVMAGKPQQLVGGALSLVVPVAVAEFSGSKGRQVLWVGLLSAALLLTMPIYAPIAFIAAFAPVAFSETPGKRVVSAVTTATGLALGVAAASFYLAPVAKGLLARRSSSGYFFWQSLSSLDISHWTIGFGFGIPLLFGVASVKPLLANSDERCRRTTVALLTATSLAWLLYLSAYLTYPLFGWSLFSWWATVPALMGTCTVASWGVFRRLEAYVIRPRAGHRLGREATVRLGTALVVAVFSMSWFVRTDDLLAYSHSPVDSDFVRAAEILKEATTKESSFLGGQEELIISGLSGRGLVYVAHAFYASPLVDSLERKKAVLDFVHHPSCETVFQLKHSYGMEAVVLNLASRWIKLLQTQSSITLEEGVPALSQDDLVFSELVAERRGDPSRVSKSVVYRASPEIKSLSCLRKAFESSSLVVFLVAK